ncbi:hypothetical protein ACP275_04G018100 [Erythranthe tilingii]
MWRRNELRFGNNAQKNQDSDQSISEEEDDLEGEWPANTISVCGAGDNKGAVQVLSQLDKLRESSGHSTEKEFVPSHEITGGYNIEDEVEIPLFNDGDGFSHYPRIPSATNTHTDIGLIYLPTMASISHSDDEIISDDEKINLSSLQSARLDTGGTWSEASREVEALVWLNEGVFVKENKSSKGGGGRKKSKPKFSFGSHSCTKDLIVTDRQGTTSSDNIPTPVEIGAAADEDMEEFMGESKFDLHDRKPEEPENHIVPFELAHKHDSKEHSMADLLYSFEAKNEMLQGSSEPEIKRRGRRAHIVLERNMNPLGDRNLDDIDLLETFDGLPPFPSDDEENPQSLKSIIPRSMADQFHEAFGVATAIDEIPREAFPQHLCGGLHKRLLQVMQSEKEGDLDYLKNISAETGFKDERMCITVRILSRSLEAKLIVCSCTCVGDGKNSYWENNLKLRTNDSARTLTIIFNPRRCVDVELEVDNLICVRPPWKEVQAIGKDEVIILCSYFAQLQP